MNTIKGSTISELEQIDDTLREMYASLQLMRVGAEAMANGETLVNVMNYVCKGLQSARAALDEVTSSVMRCALAHNDPRNPLSTHPKGQGAF